MKVSINWLKELVDLNTSVEDLSHQLNSKIQGGVKEETADYIELDLKGYNRADLLSLRGVAYEVEAITDSEVKFKETAREDLIWQNQNLPQTQVKVNNPEITPLYCIAKISGLKVAPSSPEWVKKLANSGMRTVNNVADVTNLVMLEYGQPLHSFDASQIKDETLVVRSAKTGEKLITLDNKTRDLIPTDLLITDPEKVVGLAGVMGGKNSEVIDQTNTILLEAAIFDPVILRKTASRLYLPSEASKRFQHGLTPTRTLQALDAAIRMYQQLGGKLEAISIVGKVEQNIPVIKLNPSKVTSLIGVDLTPEFIKSSLEKLHFEASEHLPDPANTSEGNQSWEVKPPYWRLDVSIEADLIEEIARMYGYENIPAKPLAGEIPVKVDQKSFDFIYNMKSVLVNLGLTEVQTYSFYTTQVLNSYDIDRNNLLKVLNPMSKETEYLRTYLAPNLVEKTAENLKYFDEVAIFEVGKIYRIEDGLPEEKRTLAIALSNNSNNPLEELHAIFKKGLESLNIEIEVTEVVLNEREQLLFHPKRFFKLIHKGQEVGKLAEVHPRILNKFGVEKRVAILEINLDL